MLIQKVGIFEILLAVLFNYNYCLLLHHWQRLSFNIQILGHTFEIKRITIDQIISTYMVFFLISRFESKFDQVHKVSTTDINEDKIEYFAGPNNDLDAKTIFDRRNLIFFSNYLVLSESPQSLNCRSSGILQ